MRFQVLVCGMIALFICPEVNAASLYLGRGAGTAINDAHYYYGGSRWPEMTALIDATFDTVTVAPALTDLEAMLAHDSLWLDSRSWYGAPLSAVEISNIQAFIQTGRRTVLMGERGFEWSTQVLSIVEGQWAGEGIGLGVANALPIIPELTGGVGSISFEQNGFGQSQGGTPLFDRPWSTLWSGNTLTILDVVVFAQYSYPSHERFAQNTVRWLAAPEPSLIGLATTSILAALVVSVRFRSDRMRCC